MKCSTRVIELPTVHAILISNRKPIFVHFIRPLKFDIGHPISVLILCRKWRFSIKADEMGTYCFLISPVLMHGGLLGVAFCPAVCLSVHPSGQILEKKSLEKNYISGTRSKVTRGGGEAGFPPYHILEICIPPENRHWPIENPHNKPNFTLLYLNGAKTVLQIPIARSPEATCSRPGYLLPEAGSPGGDLKRPYLSLYLCHRTV